MLKSILGDSPNKAGIIVVWVGLILNLIGWAGWILLDLNIVE